MKYQEEPVPSRWSPWRRWLRRFIALVPAIVGLAALGVSAVVIASVAGASNPGFVGAIVGAVIATFGNLVLQYLLAVFASWRSERDRAHEEIGLITVLMAELGEALVALSIDLRLIKNGTPEALEKLRPLPVGGWDSLK